MRLDARRTAASRAAQACARLPLRGCPLPAGGCTAGAGMTACAPCAACMQSRAGQGRAGAVHACACVAREIVCACTGVQRLTLLRFATLPSMENAAHAVGNRLEHWAQQPPPSPTTPTNTHRGPAWHMQPAAARTLTCSPSGPCPLAGGHPLLQAAAAAAPAVVPQGAVPARPRVVRFGRAGRCQGRQRQQRVDALVHVVVLLACAARGAPGWWWWWWSVLSAPLGLLSNNPCP